MLLFLCNCGAGKATATARPQANTQEPASSALTISEIMYDPGDLGGAVSADLEFIELFNRGDTPVNLGGVRFSAGIEFTFAAGTSLLPEDHVVLASSSNAFKAHYGSEPDGEYIGQLNNGGERVTLTAADDSQLLSMIYDDDGPWPVTAAGHGFSLVPRDVHDPVADLSNPDNWRFSTRAGGSPGATDPPSDYSDVAILVNEVLPHTDPPLADAVEIYNAGDLSVDIGGWYLTDDRAKPQRYRIPDGVVLAPGQFHVLLEDELGFGFSSFGEEAFMFAATPSGNLAGYVHGFRFGTSDNGVSFGRFITSQGHERLPAQRSRSLGKANTGPLVGPVVISEIMYHPAPGEDEFVRLTNITDHDVPLYDPNFPNNTWRFEGVGNFSLPQGRILSPGRDLLVVPIEPTLFREKYSIPLNTQIEGPYVGTLGNGGERISLMRPDEQDADGTVPYFEVDAVEYSDRLPWPAIADGGGPGLTRINLTSYGDDPANWRAGEIQRVFVPYVASIQTSVK